MISSSPAYQKAIVADARRMLMRAVVDISDPDIVYGTVDSSGAESVSKPEQLHDKIFSIVSYSTLERNRWMLNGEFHVFPDDSAVITDQVGFIGDSMSGESGAYTTAVWVEQQFSNVSILQACSVYFPTAEWDGYPVDFTVQIKQGGTAYHTETFTGNTQSSVSIDGFTVYNPDAIRVTVTKWSMPGRYLRTVEIIPGIYEEWNGDIIASFSLKHQADVSCVSLPYGTCTIRMDNLDRRFEPRNKSGLFQSIEERQGIDVSLACRLEDGTDEYKKVGVFYQHSGGWKTGDNGLTMQWDLVDIIGLLADREYMPPDTLPTTLDGWIASIVGQLGGNFETHYTVDPDHADLALTVNSAADISGITCGELLRMACMATGTFPRADAETGYLAVEPMWNQGSKITLDNLVNYPTMYANDDVAAIIFTIYDGDDTKYSVSGNTTASNSTISVENPFIHNQAGALTAARMILSAYGGNRYELTGRGDPASEIGDVDTVWLNESVAATARRIQQDLSFSDGVLQNCVSTLLQADGSFLFENRATIKESGTWTAPEGVTQLRVILVGKGGNGGAGTNGTWDSAGTDGADGLGGKVWAGTISINPQQQFTVTIGDDTVFGQYSSANGRVYEYGYTDIASGDSFARTGVASPVVGSGDGGAGGAGGVKGNQHTETIYVQDSTSKAARASGEAGGSGNTGPGGGGNRPGGGSTGSSARPVTITVIDNYPGTGQPGVNGVPGCVVVYWDKEN